MYYKIKNYKLSQTKGFTRHHVSNIFIYNLCFLKKKLILTSLFFILLSCTDGEVVIRKSKLNCDCVYNIERVYDDAALEYGHNSGGFRYGEFNCNNPFDYNSGQYKILSKANSFELVNNSETKLYEVLIQYKNNGNISYQTYKLEPTQVISLGCNILMTPIYNGSFYSQPDVQSIELHNISKTQFKIHKIKIISEY